ncbi:hypothetical protein HH1059_24800 [Halorhodospira halochloris]|uniref:DUF4139 domain-containing protein n=1 Tax=Halorhodospira halochloris TaxID=1052 RepID=A0A0X8X6M4_HALHR|nr:DUF4139 domain-containing protein [Halorhodospira halochloris]MBK1650940.1 hypothetical protein [Halorhodospira halochloris]BAU56556.1 hypothetical protein HH1059_24800 [Halorhodospira halochloris]
MPRHMKNILSRSLATFILCYALAATAFGDDNTSAEPQAAPAQSEQANGQDDANGVETAPAEFDDSPFEARELPAGVGEVISDRHTLRARSAKVYLQGPAVISEKREIGLPDGRARLVVQNIPREIDISSVRIASDHDPALIGSSYTSGDLSKERLLRAHTGNSIYIKPDSSASDKDWQQAQLLGFDTDYLIVVLAERAKTIPRQAGIKIAFPQPSAELHGSPTVELDLDSQRGGSKPVTISYLSGGLEWQPHYQIIRSTEDDQLRVKALARVENQTEMDFRAVDLTFVSAANPTSAAASSNLSSQPTTKPSGLTGEAAGDGRAYSLDDGQKLLAGRSYNLKLDSFVVDDGNTSYQLHGNAAANQQSGLEIKAIKIVNWTAEQNLPSGLADIYTAPDLQFRQRSKLPDTASGEEVSIPVGSSEDVTATRNLAHPYDRPIDAATDEIEWEIVVNNNASERKEVTLKEQIPSDLPAEWEILESSHETELETANTAIWQIELGEGEQKTINYRARINHK